MIKSLFSCSEYVKYKVCDACQLGKQVRSSFKKKMNASTSRCLELLHLDLFEPNSVASFGGKCYAFVIVDDYSRLTWVYFLAKKIEVASVLAKFCKQVQNEKQCSIINIRSDGGREFKNDDVISYCDKHDYTHNFSTPRSPQQNGVVERKNMTLQDMARTMLNENRLPTYFWAEAVSTAYHMVNQVSICRRLNKTPYEIWNGKTPNISYFKVFGCKCFILNDNDNLGKFDAKSDYGIFLGYATNNKAYRVYNKRTLEVEETMDVVFEEADPFLSRKV